jgi:hypothetical protein
MKGKFFSPTAGHVRLAAVVLTMVIAAVGAQAHTITTISSTIPSNGDVNPYGLAVIPTSTGSLTAGNFLVSNFNNSQNLQGTGTTIVQISPTGSFSLFAQIDPNNLPGPCIGGIGLTTALVVLKSGFVIVGSLPTTDGTSATAEAGCLLVLNNTGTVVETFFGSLINGPWDMTAADNGSTASLFVTNVLNGTVAGGGNVVNEGTVVRLDLVIPSGSMPNLQAITTIGSGFSERTDPAALVIGPTGVGLSGSGSKQVLYVADSLNNRIASISEPMTRTSSAGTGVTVSRNGSLSDPLGLTVSGGDIVTVNGNNGLAIEISPSGQQIGKALLDNSGSPPGAGALFGVVVVSGKVFYVDDATNTLNLFQ